MDMENYCGVVSSARDVYIKAYDAYSTNLPIIIVMKPDFLLVHQWEGAPLTTDHGGPVRMISRNYKLGKAQNGLVKLNLEIMMNWVTGKSVGIQIQLNLGLIIGILSLLPLDLLSKPNMCRIIIATHQPFEQNPLLLRP